MSSLEPEFEQLLSSYLDDAVTDAERAAVEARLATDAAAARELAELRSLSQSIGEADVLGDVELPHQFADQVIEAAIERARLEGHPDDHPLLRSATQPLGQAAPGTLTSVRRWWAVSGVGLAVAASLLIVVTLVRQEAEDSSDTSALALLNDPSPAAVPGGKSESNQTTAEVGSPTTADVASVDGMNVDLVAPDESTDSSVRSKKDVVERVMPNLESVAVSDSDAASPSPSGATTIDSASITDASAVAPEPEKSAAANLKLAMVLNVRLTDSAFGMAVIRDAMRTARVDSQAQQSVTDEVIASIGKTTGKASESGSLLYLRAPGKQMDRFIAALSNDEDRVERVRYGFTNEPIVLDAVSDYVRVNPTDVQHDFRGVLSSQEASAVRDRFDEVVFFPADNRGALKVGVAAQDSGPDVISHVLVLVGK